MAPVAELGPAVKLTVIGDGADVPLHGPLEGAVPAGEVNGPVGPGGREVHLLPWGEGVGGGTLAGGLVGEVKGVCLEHVDPVEPVTPLLSAVTVYTPGVWGAVKRPLALTAPSGEDQVISPGSSSMGVPAGCPWRRRCTGWWPRGGG